LATQRTKQSHVQSNAMKPLTALLCLFLLAGCGGQQFARRETDPERFFVIRQAKIVAGSQQRFKDCFFDESRRALPGLHFAEQTRADGSRVDVYSNNQDLVLFYSLDVLNDGQLLLHASPFGRFAERLASKQVAVFGACVSRTTA
jgi:hypothetical protein